MASPFPGMDPFLEGSLWTSIHFALSAEFVRQLAPRLLPRYLVLPNERLVMDAPDDVSVTTADVYPDAAVVAAQRSARSGGEGATLGAPLELATVVPAAVPHVTIEIRDTARRRLVTAIEVLSPTNKRGEGRTEYVTKRRRILVSSAHLMEIDLLRQGQRVPMKEQLPPAPYFVFLSRAPRRPVTEIWPIALADPLPVVPVPLLEGDADVPLDLQEAFSVTYDTLGLHVAVDYTKPPEIPLDHDAAEFAERRLRAAGIRP